MNKRISRNGINTIARDLNDLLYKGEKLQYYTAKGVFDAIVNFLADMLEDDNENFNRNRFFKAVYEERSYPRQTYTVAKGCSNMEWSRYSQALFHKGKDNGS